MNTQTTPQEGHRPDQQAVLASDPALGLRDRDGRTVLHHAVRMRNYETLARCVEAKAPLGMTDDAGLDPLATAVITGWIPGADRLLAAEKEAPEDKIGTAPFRRRDAHGGMLLHCAAISGAPEAVDWVYENDPNPLGAFGYPDRHGCTPLDLAAESEKPDAAKVVSQLLHQASEQGEEGVIANALKQAENTHGLTPLWTAARNGRADICTVLLTWGANPKDTDRADRPALSAAIGSGNVETVKVLVKSGGYTVPYPRQSKPSPLEEAKNCLEQAEGAEIKAAREILSLVEEASTTYSDALRAQSRSSMDAGPEAI